LNPFSRIPYSACVVFSNQYQFFSLLSLNGTFGVASLILGKGLQMSDQPNQKKKEEAQRKAVAYIVDELKKGVPKQAIIDTFVQGGVDRAVANNLVESIHGQMLKEREKERFSCGSILIAFAAGIVASIVGGVIWGLIVLVTDYEIGFMATGIGLLSGYAVLFFTEKKGLPLQVIAVISSLAGILVGKYFTFYSIVKDLLIDEFGIAAQGLSILSGEMIRLFFLSIGEIASPYDILWILLAIVAAWRIPRAIGAKAMPEI
jgi:hypothetical protein